MTVAFTPPIASLEETGSLGICHLKRYWSRTLSKRGGQRVNETATDLQYDRLVIDALGLGLDQGLRHMLEHTPGFHEFEQWVRETAGEPEPERVARFNAAVRGEAPPGSARDLIEAVERADDVLSTGDLAHWEEHGYVIVSEAVTEAVRAAAEALLWEKVEAVPNDQTTWHGPKRRGITVDFYQHPVLTSIRRSPRIHKAFAQLWRTPDLWASTDRLGFNPPALPGQPGAAVQGMHWDVSLVRPIPFGTQGILYLTDTPPEQGAFTLVPGFNRRIDAWLDSLPEGAVPGQQDLPALGAQPIGGKAGDLIIWNHLLPHGPTPNHGQRPRMVFYLNMYPASYRAQAEWL